MANKNRQAVHVTKENAEFVLDYATKHGYRTIGEAADRLLDVARARLGALSRHSKKKRSRKPAGFSSGGIHDVAGT